MNSTFNLGRRPMQAPSRPDAGRPNARSWADAAAATRARAAGIVSRIGAGIWRFLVAVGRSNARREMLQMAAQVQATRPELAARLRAAARAGWE